MAMIGNQESVRNPLVIAASENLDMQISDLKAQINILIGRLYIVSRASTPCEQSTTPGNIKVSTPLSDTLDSYSERVFAMKHDVCDAIDRLEI